MLFSSSNTARTKLKYMQSTSTACRILHNHNFKIHNSLMVHILGKKCGNVNCSILRIDSVNTSVSDLYFVISPATYNTNECSNDSLCFAVMS